MFADTVDWNTTNLFGLVSQNVHRMIGDVHFEKPKLVANADKRTISFESTSILWLFRYCFGWNE